MRVSYTKSKFWKYGFIGRFIITRKLSSIMEDQTVLTAKFAKMQTICKPPNVLVHCHEKEFQTIKSKLAAVLNGLKYTVYHLSDIALEMELWIDNAELLVVAKDCSKCEGKVEKIARYNNSHGGKLLVTCCDLVHTLAGAAEMTASSGQAEKLVRRLSREGEAIPGLSCESERIKWDELTDDERWTTLSTDCKDKQPILSAVALGTMGPIVVSSIPLFHLSNDCNLSVEQKNHLEQCETRRLNILRNLLMNELGMDCSVSTIPTLTPCYMLADSSRTKEAFLYFFNERANPVGQLKSKLLTLYFENNTKIGSGVIPVTADSLPIIADTECLAFNTVEYFGVLQTRRLGKLVLFIEVVPTTMTILGRLAEFPDIVAIAKIQTQGKGRGGNTWLSPEGCAMFTFPLTFPLKSHLGQRPSFVQHITALALVEGVKKLVTVQDLDLRIKWPNDIYIGSSKTKVGGFIVTSTILADSIQCVIGCGLNVSNAAPTACVNQLLEACGHSPVTIEQVIAKSLGQMELLVDEFQTLGPDAFIPRYLDNWMHSGSEVTLSDGRRAQVVGLDDFGFLGVKLLDSPETVSVHPDGNSFDMIRNLIIPKM